MDLRFCISSNHQAGWCCWYPGLILKSRSRCSSSLLWTHLWESKGRDLVPSQLPPPPKNPETRAELYRCSGRTSGQLRIGYLSGIVAGHKEGFLEEGTSGTQQMSGSLTPATNDWFQEEMAMVASQAIGQLLWMKTQCVRPAVI